MNTYYVTIHETDVVTYKVKAEGERDAIQRVKSDPMVADEINRDFAGFASEGEAELIGGK